MSKKFYNSIKTVIKLSYKKPTFSNGFDAGFEYALYYFAQIKNGKAVIGRDETPVRKIIDKCRFDPTAFDPKEAFNVIKKNQTQA